MASDLSPGDSAWVRALCTIRPFQSAPGDLSPGDREVDFTVKDNGQVSIRAQ